MTSRDGCAAIEPLIAAASAGPLTAADRRAVADHLGTCDACFAVAAAVGGAVEVDRAPVSDSAPPPSRRRPWVVVTMAACVVTTAAALLFALRADRDRAPVAAVDPPPGAARPPVDAPSAQECPPPEPPPRPAALVQVTTDLRLEPLGEMRRGAERVVIYAVRARDTGALVAVTVGSTVSDPHEWTADGARSLAARMKRVGRQHKKWKRDSTAGRIVYVLTQRRGKPSKVSVSVGGTRLEADWPTPR